MPSHLRDCSKLCHRHNGIITNSSSRGNIILSCSFNLLIHSTKYCTDRGKKSACKLRSTAASTTLSYPLTLYPRKIHALHDVSVIQRTMLKLPAENTHPHFRTNFSRLQNCQMQPLLLASSHNFAHIILHTPSPEEHFKLTTRELLPARSHRT